MKKLLFVSAAVGTALLWIGVSPAGASTDDDRKVTVCHVPPGNPANAHNIVISENALPAHLGHGDTLGPCSTYPPGSQAVVAPSTVDPGESFQATFLGCALG